MIQKGGSRLLDDLHSVRSSPHRGGTFRFPSLQSRTMLVGTPAASVRVSPISVRALGSTTQARCDDLGRPIARQSGQNQLTARFGVVGRLSPRSARVEHPSRNDGTIKAYILSNTVTIDLVSSCENGFRCAKIIPWLGFFVKWNSIYLDLVQVRIEFLSRPQRQAQRTMVRWRTCTHQGSVVHSPEPFAKDRWFPSIRRVAVRHSWERAQWKKSTQVCASHGPGYTDWAHLPPYR
jgi:hypothetical protein